MSIFYTVIYFTELKKVFEAVYMIIIKQYKSTTNDCKTILNCRLVS